MRRWFLLLVALNIAVFGAVIWHRRAVQPAIDPNVAMAQKLLREGIVVARAYHLNHQKANSENLKKYVYIFENAQAQAKRPELLGVYLSNDSSVLNYYAYRDDIPLIEKAVEEFDSTAITKKKGAQ